MYADVIIDITHEKLDRVFQYSIPSGLEGALSVGAEVIVPFGRGNREISGYVVEFSKKTEYPPEKIKPILKKAEKSIAIESKLVALAAWMKEQYGGKVPSTFEELLKLPGVGRKSANLIMGDVFGKPAIVTDTHCIRLTNRMGLVEDLKEPKKVEMALWKIIPPQEGSDFCHRLVYHGREVCTARTKPHCDKCCLQDVCGKKGV